MGSRNSEIIICEEPLLESFLPERILFRGGQRDKLMSCLRPAVKGRKAMHAFLYGPPGTGKTVLVKSVFREFNASTEKAVAIYVNCWKNQTFYQILREIIDTLGLIVPSGHSSFLLRRLEKFSKKQQVIICLDEVDKIRQRDDVLYKLLKSDFSLILICNNPHTLLMCDPRIRSALAFNTIEFPSYTEEELTAILKERTEKSFKPGSLADHIFTYVARSAEGDVRISLNILKAAAEEAEEEGVQAVNYKHLLHATQKVKYMRKETLLNRLNDNEKMLYSILEKAKKINSGELRRKMNRKLERKVSDTSYRKYMRKLEKLGLVRRIGKTKMTGFEIVLE